MKLNLPLGWQIDTELAKLHRRQLQRKPLNQYKIKVSLLLELQTDTEPIKLLLLLLNLPNLKKSKKNNPTQEFLVGMEVAEFKLTPISLFKSLQKQSSLRKTKLLKLKLPQLQEIDFLQLVLLKMLRLFKHNKLRQR